MDLNNPHKLAAEISTAEKEVERTNERREAHREALEKVKKRLPISVDVEACLSPKSKKNSLQEAEHLCHLLKRKDQDMLLRLMQARDLAKRDWLQTFLNGELNQIITWDLHDLNSNIQSQSSDHEKLAKLVGKLN